MILFVWAWIASINDHPALPPALQPDSDTRTSPSAPANTVAEASRPIYKTTAPELVLAYDQNEVATNKKIGNAIVEVSGHIASIDMDMMNHAVIKMATGMDFKSVNLTLEDAEKDLAASLRKDQAIVIRCKTMVRIIDSPQGDDCVVVR